MDYIPRRISSKILDQASYYQVIVITGPRQTGKTTLARHLFDDYAYYNLEDPLQREVIDTNPRDFILKGPQKLIIDEIQRLPDLFSYIQVAVDNDSDKKFVITGSSDFSLMEKITQSLAGRAALFTLLPFSFKELPEYMRETSTDSLMFKGFYPGVLVKKQPPSAFYANYCATYVERDARQINSIENLDFFRLFIRILAGRVSTEFNANSLSAEIGVSAPTIRKWLGVLKTSYIAFTLSPFHTNIEKRLTKTPKVYFYDTGLLCNQLGIRTPEQLQLHPLRGAVFENMAVVEMMKEKYNGTDDFDLYFYRENAGREVDILKCEGFDTISGYEIKSSGSFQKSYVKNLTYLRTLFPERIKETMVVYDGPTLPPVALNIRDL